MANLEIIGTSVAGRPIEAARLTTGAVPLLLMAGVHGDEPEGYYLVERFVKEAPWRELEGAASLWVIPRLNPDGCALGTRGNARGVDLNRNLPTPDWSPVADNPRYNPGTTPGSEPENQVLMRFLERCRPRVIISAHAWEPMINYNGACARLARHMAAFNGHRIADDIGYPTPGSFGTWAWQERAIPTITLEIQEKLPEPDIWAAHAKALLEALRFAAIEKELHE